MARPFFDTLHYVKRLTASNVSDEQAEAHARALSDAMNNELVRKSDLNETRSELKADINELRAEFRHDINELRAEVKHDINELRAEVKSDINDLRTEVKADINEFRAEVDGRFIKVQGQFDLLKWMIGFVLAGTMSIGGILLKMLH